MFFLTKLAGALLKPLTLIVAALVLGLLLAAFSRFRRSGLVLMGLATLTLALISWWPVANQLIAPLERQYPPVAVPAVSTGADTAGASPGAQPKRDGHPALPAQTAAIVVLGGGGIDDPSLPLSAQLSPASLQRLVEGIRLWRLRPDAVLVTSGALSQGRSQAEIAADLAVALGVPRAQIRTLPDARNTQEEAAAYADLAEALSGALDGALADSTDGSALTLSERLHRPVVVSSASHLPRAIAYFRSEGLDPLPAPTAHRALPERFALPGDFAPQADDLRTTEAAWHEYLGRLWARLRGGDSGGQ